MSSNLEARAIAKAGKTFVVNTLNDENDGVSKGKVSLREAIAEANKTPVQDTIIFANSLSGGKIKLTKGDLDITTALTIQGINSPNPIIIESTGDIFNVDDKKNNTKIKVNISDLKLQGVNVNKNSVNVGVTNKENVELNKVSMSKLGAGVDNFAAINVTRSVFDKNLLGIINRDNSTIAKISRTQISNSLEVGILNRTKITLDQSTVSKNATGGIFSPGQFYDGSDPNTSITITNSTISGNGKINDDNIGAGINVVSSKMFIINSTISGNMGVVGGIGLGQKAQVTLINSTVTKNIGNSVGGGFLVDTTSTITLGNTIVAGNVNKLSPTNLDDDVTYLNKKNVKSLGSNLIGFGDFFGAFKSPGDKVGADPRLLSLTNNGGPTQTHALRSNSPAVDGGNNSLLASTYTTDQRGQPRRRNARIDIGAYELQTKPTKNIDSLTGLESDSPVVGIAEPQTRDVPPNLINLTQNSQPTSTRVNINNESLSDSIREIILNSTSDKYNAVNLTRNPVQERDYFPQTTASDLW